MNAMNSVLRRFLSSLFVFFCARTLWAADTDVAAEIVTREVASGLNTVKGSIDIVMTLFLTYGFQVLGGLIVLAIGFFIAKTITNMLIVFLQKKNVDVTVSKFIIAIARISIIGFAILIALGKFGITIAPFIAGISVIGFGTSFALQGPLSNYAAGATLIFTKPFKVGDIIEVAGVMGEVEDMTLPRTLMKTVDGTTIVIPNKHIIGEVIHNYATQKRLDITIGISYDSNIDKSIQVLRKVIAEDSRIMSAPAPKIGIAEFADSSINIHARLWCKQNDYWDVKFDTNRAIYAAFERENIKIPFPQRDVHLYSPEAPKSPV